ncbi:MAG: hypothetical protein K0S76_408 [Herbinix sp.]|jgi:lactose/cellobiose-specific phosphotransferase system IIC component|nr:hypothetical protein [Herbinix sp.]
MDRVKSLLFRFSDLFENNKLLVAVREGLTALIPLIVLGSLSLMLKGFPVPEYQNFLSNFWDGNILVLLELMNSVTFKFLSVSLVISISYKYAIRNSTISSDTIFFPLIAVASFAALSIKPNAGFDLNSFGNSQMFSAIITAVLVNEILIICRRIIDQRGGHIIEGMDETLSVAVKTILPAAGIVILFLTINLMLRRIIGVESIQGLFESMVDIAFKKIDNGYSSLLAFIVAVQSMWFFGIHGSNVLETIVQANLRDEGVHIFCKSFYDVFVIMGGCGSALCLVIAILVFSKKQSIRGIAKLASAPCVFNISEIIILGLPVLYNPIFLIPFLLVPIVNGTISFFANYFGLVPIVSSQVEWTTPVFVSGYYATDSIKGSLLQLICIVTGVMIYLPFIRLYEERLEKSFVLKVEKLTHEFKHKENYYEATNLLSRNDECGLTAKTLAAELRRAIAKHELYWVYQPHINREGVCVGAEALVRWQHPLAGFIYPPLIIALAKEGHLLSQLEKQLLNNACQVISDLEKTNDNLSISINLTAESLLNTEMESMISEAICSNQIKPEHLWFEITEQDALSSTDEVVEKLVRLNEKGHKLLIDDFGMGHTSLLYLQTNKFDVVKLDGSLIGSILENSRNYNIISSIVYLGRSLKFDIIAEYVENEEQKQKLYELGCNGFQGYLFSKPLKTEDFLKYIKEVEFELPLKEVPNIK